MATTVGILSGQEQQRGDILYKGDYKLYLRKNGSNKITYTGYQHKNFTYNKTRNTIYLLPSKYKNQPDLFSVAEIMASNSEEAQLYYVQKGKLIKVKSTLDYSLRPKNTASNKFQTSLYSNTTIKWYINSYKLDTNKCTIKRTSSKTVDSYPTWRKDWK